MWLLKKSKALGATGFVKSVGALAALATISACGGGSAVAPSTTTPDVTYIGKTLSVNGRLVTAARLSPIPRYASILAEPQTILRERRSKKFEYIINNYGSYASIFDYPTSDQQIGQITNVGGQGCTNVLYGYGKSTFWIVASHNRITEYEVPKKPIRKLSDSFGKPSSCAMSTSGDLAVGILAGSRTHGDVVIYKHASGSGTLLTTPLTAEYFDGYDNQGNLFADGWSDGGFKLVELPKGKSTFEPITTSNTVKFPGSVQWDGTYLTVFDQDANSTYRYTVSGTTATLKHTIQFTGSSDCAQTWIVKDVIYCADAGNDDGEVFKYPAGGSPLAVFTGNFDLPLGTVAAKR
jgi:hypothetical protein